MAEGKVNVTRPVSSSKAMPVLVILVPEEASLMVAEEITSSRALHVTVIVSTLTSKSFLILEIVGGGTDNDRAFKGKGLKVWGEIDQIMSREYVWAQCFSEIVRRRYKRTTFHWLPFLWSDFGKGHNLSWRSKFFKSFRRYRGSRSTRRNRRSSGRTREVQRLTFVIIESYWKKARKYQGCKGKGVKVSMRICAV